MGKKGECSQSHSGSSTLTWGFWEINCLSRLLREANHATSAAQSGTLLRVGLIPSLPRKRAGSLLLVCTNIPMARVRGLFTASGLFAGERSHVAGFPSVFVILLSLVGVPGCGDQGTKAPAEISSGGEVQRINSEWDTRELEA